MEDEIQIYRSGTGDVLVTWYEDHRVVYILRQARKIWALSVILSEDTALSFTDLTPEEQHAVLLLVLAPSESRVGLYAGVL